MGSGKNILPAARSLANSVLAHTPPSLIEPENKSEWQLQITYIINYIVKS